MDEPQNNSNLQLVSALRQSLAEVDALVRQQERKKQVPGITAEELADIEVEIEDLMVARDQLEANLKKLEEK